MIDSRIKSIINFVKENSRVVDVGADHAYLAIELVKSGRTNFVIATDKNDGPILAAKKNISAAGFEKIIEVRQGDGLKIIRDGEVDTICIAGMGGDLICKILSASPDVVGAAKNLILQPMNAVELLENWLAENKWFVNDFEFAEVDEIIYKIISAEKNFNPVQKKSSALEKKYLEKKIEKLQKILIGMSKSSSARSSENFFAVQDEIKKINEEIEKLCL